MRNLEFCQQHFLVQPTILVHLSLSLFYRALATWTVLAPSMILLSLWPSKSGFLYGLVISSLTHFLLSYHVHEKTILLPLLTIGLLSMDHPVLAQWMNTIALFRSVKRQNLAPWYSRSYSCFLFPPPISLGFDGGIIHSLYPLLKKDGQSIPYLAMMLFHFTRHILDLSLKSWPVKLWTYVSRNNVSK